MILTVALLYCLFGRISVVESDLSPLLSMQLMRRLGDEYVVPPSIYGVIDSAPNKRLAGKDRRGAIMGFDDLEMLRSLDGLQKPSLFNPIQDLEKLKNQEVLL
ncbi:unnamed protein product [Gongylonema pulchrum]|uniref:T2SSG domain-containing protein n=1 Tax=Gongylonema pulchrum TaxID=637853 RepID=A0A183CXU6_9BILA|nr:unnamed protein product [Gongylonema pulchrum]